MDLRNITSDAPDNCPECGSEWSAGESVKTGDERALDGWEDWRYCSNCKNEPFYPHKLAEQEQEQEQEQAGEAVAACYIRSGWIEQLQGGKDRVMAALARTPCNLFTVPLYTRPQQPLSDEHAEALRGLINSTQISSHESCAVYHAMGALGITKEPKT